MYTFPNSIIINDIKLPYYLGLGIIDHDSIVAKKDFIRADYFEQQRGQLTNNLVISILLKKDNATVYRYFDGDIYTISTEKTLELAFFKSFHFKKIDGITTVTSDKPLFEFGKEIANLGAYTFLWNTSYMYFPASFLIKINKPLLDEKTAALWKSFAKKYENSVDDEKITNLKNAHSPFSTIEADGTGVVLPVFLKDALALINEYGLMGDTKETALKVLYV